MNTVAKAIVLLAVGGNRQKDGTVKIAGEILSGFPDSIAVEGCTFGLSETEEIDAETGYTLGHYVLKEARTTKAAP